MSMSKSYLFRACKELVIITFALFVSQAGRGLGGLYGGNKKTSDLPRMKAVGMGKVQMGSL